MFPELMVMKKPLPPKVKKFSAAKQRLLDKLLEKNSDGSIAPKERVRLEQLVAEAERLMVANAKRLARFSERESSGAPSGAVPVTVWVKSEAGR
jgi:hypothetical protein